MPLLNLPLRPSQQMRNLKNRSAAVTIKAGTIFIGLVPRLIDKKSEPAYARSVRTCGLPLALRLSEGSGRCGDTPHVRHDGFLGAFVLTAICFWRVAHHVANVGQ